MSDFHNLKPLKYKVTWNVNTKLSERFVTMKRRCDAKKHYSRRECREILDIPAKVADNSLESTVLEILEEIDVAIDLGRGLSLFILEKLFKESHHKSKSP